MNAVPAEGEYLPVLEAEARRLLEIVYAMGVTTTSRRYEPGEVVYRWEPDDGLYLLTAGAIKVITRHSGDKRTVSRLIGPWEHFGRLWVAGGPDEPDSEGREVAEAMVLCEVEKVPRVFARRAVRLRPTAALSLATLLELRLAEEEEFARCLLPRGTRGRLARLLPLLLRKFGAQTNGAFEGAGEVGLPLTRGRLAEMISSTRESVTKAMIELRDEGLVSMQGGRVVLLDPEGLDRIG